MDDKAKLAFGTAAIIGGSIIVAAYVAGPPRYAMVGSGGGGAFRLDRSSGEVFFCNPYGCVQAEAIQEDPQGNEAADGANATAYPPIENVPVEDMSMDLNMTTDMNAFANSN